MEKLSPKVAYTIGLLGRRPDLAQADIERAGLTLQGEENFGNKLREAFGAASSQIEEDGNLQTQALIYRESIEQHMSSGSTALFLNEEERGELVEYMLSIEENLFNEHLLMQALSLTILGI